MPMSNYLRNQIVDHIFRTATYAKPTALYLGLFTAAPTTAGGGTEVVGGAYGRVNLPPLNTNWSATQGGTSGASSGTTGLTKNAVAITFPTPTADWGTVTSYGIFDGLTGNLLFFGLFTLAKAVLNGDQAPLVAVDGFTATWT